MRLALLGAACALASGLVSTQLRVTFSPRANELVAGWTSLGTVAPGASLLEAGPSPTLLTTRVAGATVAFGNEYCPDNSTRTSHSAAFPAPPGAVTYYRVTSDGGATWSAVLGARNPQRDFPLAIALWGDLGVECGGVLPPSPGFAGGQCTAVPQLAADAQAGRHALSIHFGDTGYNMDERCGEKGDAFLDAASSYSAIRPHVYTNGNHEGSGSLKP